MKGGIILNEKQNPMPWGTIGEPPFGVAGAGCACGNGGAYADARLSAAVPCAPCGSCGGRYDETAKVCGFGVEAGVLASVYVPLQAFDGIYDTATAWHRGTLFEGLDKPFYGDGREVDCRGRER